MDREASAPQPRARYSRLRDAKGRGSVPEAAQAGQRMGRPKVIEGTLLRLSHLTSLPPYLHTSSSPPHLSLCRYIESPLLLDGRKFDIRLLALIAPNPAAFEGTRPSPSEARQSEKRPSPYAPAGETEKPGPPARPSPYLAYVYKGQCLGVATHSLCLILALSSLPPLRLPLRFVRANSKRGVRPKQPRRPEHPLGEKSRRHAAIPTCAKLPSFCLW